MCNDLIDRAAVLALLDDLQPQDTIEHLVAAVKALPGIEGNEIALTQRIVLRLAEERDTLRASLAEAQAQVEGLRNLPPDYGHDGPRWRIGAAMRRSIDAAHSVTDHEAALYHAFLAGLRAAMSPGERHEGDGK